MPTATESDLDRYLARELRRVLKARRAAWAAEVRRDTLAEVAAAGLLVRKAGGGLVLEEVKPGVHRWVRPDTGEGHDAHPETGEPAGDAHARQKTAGLAGKVKAKVDAFLVNHATTVHRIGQLASAIDAVTTTPEDVLRWPWLAGKFSANTTATGDALGDTTGVPGHLAARVVATAIVKAWQGLKTAAGVAKAKADRGDALDAAAEMLAGLANAALEAAGLPGDVDAGAVREWLGGLGQEAGDDGDPHAAIAEAMVEHAHASKEAGEDAGPGLDALRALLDDPAELARALGGTDSGEVAKAVGWVVLKAQHDADKHPRGKDGRFIAKGAIEDAKGDPAKAAELRARVRPQDAAALDKQLAAPQKGPGAKDLRKHAAERGAKVLAHLGRTADLKAKLTADDLHALAEHLADPAVTVAHLREVRRALRGNAVRAGFGGAKVKEGMVAALAAHARRAGFEARLKEQGIAGDAADEMRRAAGLVPKEVAAAPDPVDPGPQGSRAEVVPDHVPASAPTPAAPARRTGADDANPAEDELEAASRPAPKPAAQVGALPPPAAEPEPEPATPLATPERDGVTHNFRLGGRNVSAMFNPDGSTRVEERDGVKVVTYTGDDGVRSGYVEDAGGGNVRPFIVRKPAGGYDSKPGDAASAVEQLPADAGTLTRLQAEADKKRADRRATFEQNTGYHVIHPQHATDALRKAGFESYRSPRPRAGEPGRGGVDVNAVPGKKTWLSVEFKPGVGEDADYDAKAAQMETALKGSGFHVERSRGDPNVLLIRKPVSAAPEPAPEQSAGGPPEPTAAPAEPTPPAPTQQTAPTPAAPAAPARRTGADDANPTPAATKPPPQLPGRPGASVATAADAGRPLGERLAALGDLDTAALDHVQRVNANIGGNEYGRVLEMQHERLAGLRPGDTKEDRRHNERLRESVADAVRGVRSKLSSQLIPALRAMGDAPVPDDDGRPLPATPNQLADAYEAVLPGLADEVLGLATAAPKSPAPAAPPPKPTGHPGLDAVLAAHASAPTPAAKEALAAALWNAGVEDPSKPPRNGLPAGTDDRKLARTLTGAYLQLRDGGATPEELAHVEGAMRAHGIEPVGAAGDAVRVDGRYHQPEQGHGPNDPATVRHPGWVHRGADGQEYLLHKATLEKPGAAKGPGAGAVAPPPVAPPPPPASPPATGPSLKDAVRAHLERTKTRPIMAVPRNVREAIAASHPGADAGEVTKVLQELHAESKGGAAPKAPKLRAPNPHLPDQSRAYLKDDAARAAVSAYQMSDYRGVNDMLWSGTPDPDAERVHAGLQKAFAATPPLPKPVTVHRGPSLTKVDRDRVVADLKRHLADGTPYDHKGYMSTSTGGIVKEGETEGNVYDRPLQLVVTAKRGLDVTPVADDEHKNEREMLLPPGKFKVSKVEERGGKTFVHMEQLDA